MVAHPYFPLQVPIVGYVPNSMSVPALLTSFAGGCAAIFAVTLLVVSKLRSGISGGDKATILWFVLCGFIHFFFEGYFAVNHTQMASRTSLFGQLWKEYSLSDSRYLISDPFVLCMETITAISWGPLSFLLAYLIAVDSPYRYPLQAIVSLGQLYGDVLYYMTSFFDLYYRGLSYSRPDGHYFWVYFVGMNAFWIVIPLYLILQSVHASARAFVALNKVDSTLKKSQANGHAKKTL